MAIRESWSRCWTQANGAVEGNEVVIKVSESQTVVDMSLGTDAKRLAIASASGVLGRAVKLKIVPSATIAPTDGQRNGGCPSRGNQLRLGRPEPSRTRCCRPPAAGKVWRRDSYGDRLRGEAVERYGRFNLQELMSKAKSQYDALQKKMQDTVVEATSGGGTVTAKMDGRKQLLSLRIDPEAVKSGDVEMLQDLVLAAVNEAARKVDNAMQSTVGGMLGGLGISGL